VEEALVEAARDASLADSGTYNATQVWCGGGGGLTAMHMHNTVVSLVESCLRCKSFACCDFQLNSHFYGWGFARRALPRLNIAIASACHL
jgi:hypothetical protein